MLPVETVTFASLPASILAESLMIAPVPAVTLILLLAVTLLVPLMLSAPTASITFRGSIALESFISRVLVTVTSARLTASTFEPLFIVMLPVTSISTSLADLIVVRAPIPSSFMVRLPPTVTFVRPVVPSVETTLAESFISMFLVTLTSALFTACILAVLFIVKSRVTFISAL